MKFKVVAFKTLLIAAIFVFAQSYTPKEEKPTLQGGCKFTDDITDFCRTGRYKVLNCVNNTETDDCGFDVPIGELEP